MRDRIASASDAIGHPLTASTGASTRPLVRAAFRVVASIIAAAGCTTTTTASPGPSSPATSTETNETIDPALLGAFCSGVGLDDGKVLAFAGVSDCPTAICVADGRRHVTAGGNERIDTYCTASCESDACPEAWECIDNTAAGDGSPKRVCVKQAPVCGDGIKQLDEVCEDGNSTGKDGCSADCTKSLPAGIHVKSFEGRVRGPKGDSLKLSKTFYITDFPDLEDSSGIDGLGELDKITAESFTVKVGATDKAHEYGYEVDAVVSRAVGKATTLDGLEGFWKAAPTKPTADSEVEVTAAHVDGRAYEVHIHLEMPVNAQSPDDGTVVIDTTFVATMPAAKKGSQ